MVSTKYSIQKDDGDAIAADTITIGATVSENGYRLKDDKTYAQGWRHDLGRSTAAAVEKLQD